MQSHSKLNLSPFSYMTYSLLLALVLIFCGAAAPYKPYNKMPAVTHILYEVSDFFINVLGDVPLMEGVSVDYDSLLIFDKAEGRFIEVLAYPVPALEQKSVADFYEASLPMLGWRAMGDLSFVREGERLKILFPKGNDGWIVRFVMSPEKK